ncbi:hypothetical protein EI94DRAFT_1716486 [Lactarius quietus]|nr:hypothetical protein EI94DRAFT_1716486 [Lactarius quietus]
MGQKFDCVVQESKNIPHKLTLNLPTHPCTHQCVKKKCICNRHHQQEPLPQVMRAGKASHRKTLWARTRLYAGGFTTSCIFQGLPSNPTKTCGPIPLTRAKRKPDPLHLDVPLPG